ncbi:MAG: hypothetical protein K2Q26_10120 [Bdellovibrionales bacterium]|nr:hypothetical protein [Bdellovibrionales bacterium]
MKHLVFAILSLGSTLAIASPFDNQEVIICGHGNLSYRLALDSVKVQETVQKSPGVLSIETRHQSSVINQTRVVEVSGSSKFLTYTLKTQDGSKATIQFILRDEKGWPHGYPEFQKGDFSGPFTQGNNVSLEKCSAFGF